MKKVIKKLFSKSSSRDKFFDSEYYLNANPDLVGVKSLKSHFTGSGIYEGRSSSIFFDPIFCYMTNKDFLENFENFPLDIFEKKINRSSILFDVKYYLNHIPINLNRNYRYLIKHYLDNAVEKNISPCPHFDSEYYLSKNPDVKKTKFNAFNHYLLFGEKEGRKPNPYFSPKLYSKPTMPNGWNIGKYRSMSKFEFYILEKIGMTEDYFQAGFEYYTKYKKHLKNNGNNISKESQLIKEKMKKNSLPNLNRNGTVLNYINNQKKHSIDNRSNPVKEKLENKFLKKFMDEVDEIPLDEPIVIFISHEGSRTGAPLIILNIAKYLNKMHNIHCINLLCNGGEILEDFETLGPTYTYHLWREPDNFHHEIFTILDHVLGKKIIGAIVNSAESRRNLEYLRVKNINNITLIHEIADYYPKNEWNTINEFSDKIIFPSQMVYDLAVKNNQFDHDKLMIKGQGLFKPELLDVNRSILSAALRKELKIKKDSFIVLGCGTPNARKGIDNFMSIALSTISNDSTNKIHFMWLGEAAENEAYKWARHDLKRSEHESNFHFIGAKKDIRKYFGGSNLFLMTSKGDPFPCVIHEAMACQLPVLGFNNAGGFVEAVEQDAGFLFDYGDIYSVTGKILELSKNLEKVREIGELAKIKVIEKYKFEDYSDIILQELIDINRNEDAYLENFVFPNRADSKINDSNKVVFTLPNWWISGVNTFVEHCVRELNRNGFDAYILFTMAKENEMDEELMPDVPYKYLVEENRGQEYVWNKLKNYLEALGHCVFVPNYDYVASAISGTLSDDVGILGVLHSDDVEHYEHAYRLGLYWNKIVSVSNTIEKQLLEYNPSFKSKSDTVYYGIDKFNFKDNLREEDLETIRLVYTGRIVEYQKNVSHFIPIIEELEKRGVNFKITFIGDGDSAEILQEELDQYIREDKVRFLGRVGKQEIISELSKSHAFVLTSEFEGLPLSLLESMHCGCVPIVTDIKSGISEILTHDVNALISPFDNFSKFCDNVEFLANSKDNYLRLSTAAKKTMRDKKLYSDNMGEKYINIINEIFFELKSGEYERLEPLVFNSKYDNILPHPMFVSV